jgi:hypothetical protein
MRKFLNFDLIPRIRPHDLVFTLVHEFYLGPLLDYSGPLDPDYTICRKKDICARSTKLF